jgi:uncharacterized membrane protein
MMTLFNDKIDIMKKRLLFIVFMSSCVVSHYSTTYVFFFILLGAFVGIEILTKKYTLKRVISLKVVALFSTLIFFWYSQVTEAAFNQGVIFFERTVNSLNHFFIQESRRDTAQLMLGEGIQQMVIPYQIHFVLTWITFALISIGVITLIWRYREMSFPELEFDFKKPDFLKAKFEVEYFIIAIACSGLLVAVVAVPYISHYGLGRVYAVAITILSVFFVIGGIMLSKHFFFFTKRKTVLKEKQKSFTKRSHRLRENGSEVLAYLVILLVLIPYFLCATGVMYTIFGDPKAIILNSEGEEYDRLYIHDHQQIAKEWLSSSEVVEGRLVNKEKTIDNMEEYLGGFDENNRVYDNGGSEIWKW